MQTASKRLLWKTPVMNKSSVLNVLLRFRAGKWMIGLIYHSYNRIIIFLRPDKDYLRKRYLEKNGEYPDLVKPEKFSEKIIWLILNDHTPLHQICADKIAVRQYVAKTIGDNYLVPFFSTANDYSLKLVDSVPENTPFIIKSTHGSFGGVICLDKNDLNTLNAKIKLRRDLVKSHFYTTREPQYKNIKPKLIVEKLLLNNGKPATDFKVFCFNGEPRFIQVDCERHVNHTRNIYDLNWKLLDVSFQYPNGVITERPDCLDDLLQLSRKLSQPFKFARVDFYISDGRIYFGEITFHPESGLIRFVPDHYEQLFGSYLKI